MQQLTNVLFVRSVWCSLQYPCCSGVSRPNHLAPAAARPREGRGHNYQQARAI